MKIVMTCLLILLSGCVKNSESNVNQVLKSMTETENKVFNQMADIDKVLFENCISSSPKSLCFMSYAERTRPQSRSIRGIDPGSAALGVATGYLLAPKKK